MHAQQFRTPVRLDKRQSGQDPTGQPIDTWATFASTFGDIRYLSGTESLKADAQASINRASVRIRYMTGLSSGMRLIASDSTFEVRAVMPDVKGKRYVDLVCEVVNNGY